SMPRDTTSGAASVRSSTCLTASITYMIAAYRFWVIGSGSTGFKRDPRARELGTIPSYPSCDCLIRDPGTYPWHDAGFRTPEFRDLIQYQLHIGVFYAIWVSGLYFPHCRKSATFPRVTLAGAGLWPAISGISLLWRGFWAPVSVRFFPI